MRALAAEGRRRQRRAHGRVPAREAGMALPQVEEVRGLGLMVACDLAEGVSAP